MPNSITTVRARSELKPRVSPYTHMLRKGWFLGFQKTSATAAGTWKARFTDENSRTIWKSLGGFGEIPPAGRFDAAKVAAEEWLRHVSKGGSSKPQTVRGACEAYLAYLRDKGREKTAQDAEGRFRRWVYTSRKFGDTELMRLTPKAVEAWVTALRKAPVILQDKSKTGTPPKQPSPMRFIGKAADQMLGAPGRPDHHPICGGSNDGCIEFYRVTWAPTPSLQEGQ